MMHQFFVTCPKGLADSLALELSNLGITVKKQTPAGIHAMGDISAIYTTILWSRLANRVLLYLCQGEVKSQQQLYQLCHSYDWLSLFNLKATICVDFHGESYAIKNSMFGAQCVKDAIVDRIRAATGTRPNVDRDNPDIRINVLLKQDQATISLDLVGHSLHQRSYRYGSGSAPLKENLAAALLYRSQWPQQLAQGYGLIDPCCGVGTIAIEAAFMATQFAPGLLRHHIACVHWRQHDAAAWMKLRDQAKQIHQEALLRPLPPIIAYDNDPRAIAAAKKNAEHAKMQSLIQFEVRALKQFELPATMRDTPNLLLANPPYGERLNDITSLIPLYQELGSAIATLPALSQAAILTSHELLAKAIGLYSHKQYAFYNGAIPCKLYQYHVREQCQPKYTNATTTAIPAAAQSLYNRLVKNHKHLSKWLNKQAISNYRIYDADIPEYAFAIDIYADWAHVQEYLPPRDIDPKKAQQRLLDALIAIPHALAIPAAQIVIKHRERQKGKAQYQRQETTDHRLMVREAHAKFWVNLYDFIDTGLFLDHRPLRQKLAAAASGKTLLNLFCYTATASVHAALAGATTVNVDMSHTYLEWAKQNFRLNQLELSQHRFIQADCLQWLTQQSEKFDVIFLDPPSFSNSKRMHTTLDIQRDHEQLIQATMQLLKPDGTLYFSNNFRKFQLASSIANSFQVKDITLQTIDKDFARDDKIHHCFVVQYR